MSTLGYVLIAVAALALRSVLKGRAANIAEDLGDTFVAVIRGDVPTLREINARTGESTTAPQAVPTTPGASGDAVFQSSTGGAIYANALKLGKGKRYGWGATGPNAYDCSGLMWRACIAASAYHGARFTTTTIPFNDQFTRVTDPRPDDIVCWIGSHMGVVVAKDEFYSAMNYQSGIGLAKISTWGGGKRTPTYFRPTTVISKDAGTGKGASGGGGGSW
jgi:cell wall-associated NlpC family hydrolase